MFKGTVHPKIWIQSLSSAATGKNDLWGFWSLRLQQITGAIWWTMWRCFAVKSSRNILWTAGLHLTLYHPGGRRGWRNAVNCSFKSYWIQQHVLRSVRFLAGALWIFISNSVQLQLTTSIDSLLLCSCTFTSGSPPSALTQTTSVTDEHSFFLPQQQLTLIFCDSHYH